MNDRIHNPISCYFLAEIFSNYKSELTLFTFHIETMGSKWTWRKTGVKKKVIIFTLKSWSQFCWRWVKKAGNTVVSFTPSLFFHVPWLVRQGSLCGVLFYPLARSVDRKQMTCAEYIESLLREPPFYAVSNIVHFFRKGK